MKSKFVNDFNNETHQEIYNQIRDLTVWGFKTSKEIFSENSKAPQRLKLSAKPNVLTFF